jgi:hypothetical protein
MEPGNVEPVGVCDVLVCGLEAEGLVAVVGRGMALAAGEAVLWMAVEGLLLRAALLDIELEEEAPRRASAWLEAPIVKMARALPSNSRLTPVCGWGISAS